MKPTYLHDYCNSRVLTLASASFLMRRNIFSCVGSSTFFDTPEAYSFHYSSLGNISFTLTEILLLYKTVQSLIILQGSNIAFRRLKCSLMSIHFID